MRQLHRAEVRQRRGGRGEAVIAARADRRGPHAHADPAWRCSWRPLAIVAAPQAPRRRRLEDAVDGRWRRRPTRRSRTSIRAAGGAGRSARAPGAARLCATTDCASAPTGTLTSGIRRPATSVDAADRRGGVAVAAAAEGGRVAQQSACAAPRRRAGALQLCRPTRGGAARGAEELRKSGAATRRCRCSSGRSAREKDAGVREALEAGRGAHSSLPGPRARADARRARSVSIATSRHRRLLPAAALAAKTAEAARRAGRRSAGGSAAGAARGREPPAHGRDRRRAASRHLASATSCCSRRSGWPSPIGLMGVINMAHGELMMIGAYATYVVQNLFRRTCRARSTAYLLAAIPVAFLAAALVGVVLERGVIRFLYGRPLETLLATWGISLILIQPVRTIFGAQNVQVENPAWMSGGVEIVQRRSCCRGAASSIIGFAALVLGGVWFAAARARGSGCSCARVTQNRAMAACLGVPHGARRHARVRPGLGHRGARRLRAVADRQRRPRPRPELHRRLVHGRRAGRRRPARGHGVAGARPRHPQQVPRAGGRARCSRRSSCSCSSSCSSRSGRRACSR